MCDELTEIDNESFSNGGGALSRRDFSKLSAAAIMSLMFPTNALGQEVVEESDVMVNMRDGVSDCYYVRPSSGKHPAVLMWPDIKGLRPAFRAMGKRLAMQGYSVLVVNPFYRDAKAPVVGEGASFSDPETRKFLIAMARKLTQNASMADARAYIEFLDAQDNVDTNRKVGTLGYCMGGPLIMRTAGAVPNRVGAAASFHGGGLVSDADDSPHLLIPSSSAHVLHAIAENDDERGLMRKMSLRLLTKRPACPLKLKCMKAPSMVGARQTARFTTKYRPKKHGPD